MFLSPSLLSTLSSLFGRSGLFGPPLCGGSAPATPPLLQPPPHRVCGNMTLATRCDQNFPRIMTRPEYVPAQARQARQYHYIRNVHRDGHREPATEILTEHSPRQTAHSTHTELCLEVTNEQCESRNSAPDHRQSGRTYCKRKVEALNLLCLRVSWQSSQGSCCSGKCLHLPGQTNVDESSTRVNTTEISQSRRLDERVI